MRAGGEGERLNTLDSAEMLLFLVAGGAGIAIRGGKRCLPVPAV
jgi:hypothetical protein